MAKATSKPEEGGEDKSPVEEGKEPIQDSNVDGEAKTRHVPELENKIPQSRMDFYRSRGLVDDDDDDDDVKEPGKKKFARQTRENRKEWKPIESSSRDLKDSPNHELDFTGIDYKNFGVRVGSNRTAHQNSYIDYVNYVEGEFDIIEDKQVQVVPGLPMRQKFHFDLYAVKTLRRKKYPEIKDSPSFVYGIEIGNKLVDGAFIDVASAVDLNQQIHTDWSMTHGKYYLLKKLD